MQSIGYFTLAVMLFMLAQIEIASSNPCSQFSEPGRQMLCSSDDLPGFELNDN